MTILISIVSGILAIIIGNWIALVFSLILGFAVEPIANKMLSESKIKKARYFWGLGWVGFTVGMINAILVYAFNINGWILFVLFIVYILFVMEKRNESFVLHDVCDSDNIVYYKLSRVRTIIIFITFSIGFYCLWTILIL